MDIMEAFARISDPLAGFLSLFPTAYILGCLLLAAHIGKAVADRKALDKWLQTALRDSKNASSGEGKERELEGKAIDRINPHEVVS